MKTVDHSYEQALIMHDNVHIHVIMNIIVTPIVKKQRARKAQKMRKLEKALWQQFFGIQISQNCLTGFIQE